MDIHELSELIRQGYSGRQLTTLFTGRTDSLLENLFLSINAHSGLCLMAVGGYGRGELAPFSDIDIMLFARDRSASEKASEFLYKLWDTNRAIGHSFRTPPDCISEARKDVKTRTSLLEHRYIAGDKDLYRYFMDTVYPEIAFRESARFITEKLREIEMRHRNISDSVFMLEPHVKEGRGALRDIHALLWLASIKLRLRCFDELGKILSPEEFRRLSNAYDFLLKTRFCLHVLSGRRNDILSFEFHDSIAGMLNFKASKRFLSSERFMRYFYLKASAINDITSRSLDLFSMPRTDREERDSRILPFLYAKKRITDDFFLSRNRIVTNGDCLRKKPETIVEAFSVRAKTGKRFSPLLSEEIGKNLHRIGKTTRSSQKAVESFMSIIRGDRAYETLKEMHTSRVLGRLIPEFGALSFLVVYEPYHRYTVDEHALYAVKKLVELGGTKYKNLEHLSAVFKEVRHKEALIFSLLLHDIGKKGIVKSYRYGSGGGHHEEAGYLEVKNILERFNLTAGLRTRIEFLVKNHTLMSSVAFKGDMEDSEVIAQFADDVGDREHLDALYLLTYADIASVSPDFWTEWKAYLLKELYEITSQYLSGFPGVSPMSRGLGSVQAAHPFTRTMVCSDNERAGLEQFLALMPERYIVSSTPERISADYGLYRQVTERGFGLRVREDSAGTAEIIVGAWDSPGLFSRVVGVLSSLGLNIYRARVYTGKGGIVIDKIQIANWGDICWDGLCQDLESKLRDEACSRDEEQWSRSGIQEIRSLQGYSEVKPEVLGRFGPFIEIDNESSRESSILEFFAQDRLGLLYDATSLIHERDIDIISARINTESGIANDIFSLQQRGRKLEGMTIHELLLSLWERLQ
ncbi:MAG TPA: [protein-PII] uridylyltransferase [Thermodesulfovibrionales bacterium]|nr:[protein-PII] uridylyltransferase [Thermodesulfovibrionales bacterium]